MVFAFAVSQAEKNTTHSYYEANKRENCFVIEHRERD